MKKTRDELGKESGGRRRTATSADSDGDGDGGTMQKCCPKPEHIARRALVVPEQGEGKGSGSLASLHAAGCFSRVGENGIQNGKMFHVSRQAALKEIIFSYKQTHARLTHSHSLSLNRARTDIRTLRIRPVAPYSSFATKFKVEATEIILPAACHPTLSKANKRTENLKPKTEKATKVASLVLPKVRWLIIDTSYSQMT